MKLDKGLFEDVLKEFRNMKEEPGSCYTPLAGTANFYFQGNSKEEIDCHMNMAIVLGFVDGERLLGGNYTVRSMTSKGHQFMESVEDPAA